MNYVFLMDPLSTVVYEKDTTFMFMLEAKRRGYQVYYLPSGGITKKGEHLLFDVQQVIPQTNSKEPFVLLEKKVLNDSEVDCIFIRTDPPFDLNYLMNTWLLDLISDKVAIINHPNGVRTVNEKIWATQFTSLIPKTLVTSNCDQMRQFMMEEKKIVVKPTDGFGGQHIEILNEYNDRTESILKSLSEDWQRKIILQRFVEESVIGDKRILLLNGEPLGAVLRVHSDGGHLNNFMAGGKPHPTEITQRDLEIIHVLAPKLRALGLYFVGIDVMGDYLIEVNVTSPTCLQEINALSHGCLEQDVITFSEQLVQKRSPEGVKD